RSGQVARSGDRATTGGPARWHGPETVPQPGVPGGTVRRPCHNRESQVVRSGDRATTGGHEGFVARRSFMSRTLALGLLLLGGIGTAQAQPPNARIGEAVPRDVRELYDKGLQYLAKTQSENGDW